MVVGAKTAAAGVSAVGMVTLLSGLAVHFRTPRSVDNNLLPLLADSGGAVPGRVVAVPVSIYKKAFKDTLKLGQCPLVMDGTTIKTCNDKFEGEEVFLGRASFIVDVTRVQSSEDITQHIMGGLGASVGVLGLVSVGTKYNVAVTTDTKKENLNLLSSYEMLKGVISLHGAKPTTVITESGALFLSEIEIGGDETLLVTLEFESEQQRVEVSITVTFKILFWSISAKISFVHTTFKSKAKVRIQFISSFREDTDTIYNDLGEAVGKVEEAEREYMRGPMLLRDMKNDDERTHNFYYFSSWKVSPYGANYNLALINHDLDFLNEQNTEMKNVLHRLDVEKQRPWSSEQRHKLDQLYSLLTEKTKKLSTGIEKYHSLTPGERQKLRDVYGEDKSPLYYTRELNAIVDKTPNPEDLGNHQP
ncbi:hypothetical protein JTE90_021353 [Oedothorax gibbosus]|uniref:Uncharacterized protein n=1 Tax=Oedothorax gibbosus TaxID=931172 RepID=A0AAV6TX12_9ARAC|nr:hypothetical protein JTE90_021353 [Oedothorax gibbosus]